MTVSRFDRPTAAETKLAASGTQSRAAEPFAGLSTR